MNALGSRDQSNYIPLFVFEANCLMMLQGALFQSAIWRVTFALSSVYEKVRSAPWYEEPER